MKRLTILRHAKSSWDDASLADFDRPLNERGWKTARLIGREIKKHKLQFELCLASPAARVRETLDGVAEGFGDFEFEVRFEPQIYEASAARLLDLVTSLPKRVGAALLVGHNPGLQQLVTELTKDGKLHRRAADKFPTAAVAVIELPVDDWGQVRAGRGELVELILPKELD